MKQIYALNVCRSARCWLHLMLVVWCGVAAAKSPVRDSAALRLPVQTDRVAAGDLVITASQIRAVDPVDLWKAISFYDSSISNSWEREHGSDPVYGAGDMTVRGSKRWARDEAVKPSRPLYIIDGALVDARKFFDTDINDVRQIIIRKDPVSLAQYGIRSADGVVEMKTQKPVKGPLKVRYMFDGIVEWADLGSYDLMSASEQLALIEREGLTTGSVASMQQHKASGKNVDWLNQLTRTVFRHRHKITVDGGDDNVKYALTGRIAPSGKGVVEGVEKDILGLGAYIEYRYKSFRISNDLTYDKTAKNSKLFGTLGDYARTPRWLDPDNGHGGYLKTMGHEEDAVRFENPLYELTLGSHNECRTYSIFDNVRLSLDLGAGFSVNGRFSFVRDLIRTDTYVSPASVRYASQTTDSYTGRYGIARSSIQTYDGAVDLTYRGSRGRSFYGASLQAGIFSGTYNMESYAGVGIPSDKMGYISFTKAYDPDTAPYAWRYYDRTVSGTLSAHYSYDERYTVAGTAHLDRSSMLAPGERTALFYGVSAAWNIGRERFLRRADWIDRLTLSAAIGTSGAVDALNSDYVVTYSSNIDNEYVYNYYLVGASVNFMPNPDLKWRTLVSRSVALQAEFAHALRLRVEYYNNDSKDLMTVDRLPLASGYRRNVSNGGRVRNSGLEYYLNATLYSRPGLSVSAFTSGSHNRNRIGELPGFFAAWYNEALSEGEAPLSEGESVNAIYAAESSFDGTTERAAGEAVAAGRAEPDLKGNFGVNVTWGKWHFGAAFDYRIGGQTFNRTLYDVQFGSPLYNLDRRALNPKYRRAFDGEPVRLQRFVERFDALNFSAVQVGYVFGAKAAGKLYMRNLALYLTGSNLFYCSGVDMQRGTVYPYTRTVTLSLRATF